MIFEITDKQKSPILLSQAGWGFCLCNNKPKNKSKYQLIKG